MSLVLNGQSELIDNIQHGFSLQAIQSTNTVGVKRNNVPILLTIEQFLTISVMKLQNGLLGPEELIIVMQV